MLNLVEVVQSNSFELEITYATAEVQTLLVGKFLKNYIFWQRFGFWDIKCGNSEITLRRLPQSDSKKAHFGSNFNDQLLKRFADEVDA